MQSFLTWQLNVYIHTIMVNICGAAVLPKEAFFFGPKRDMFRFEQLNAFTAQIRGNKIDFFMVESFMACYFNYFHF